MGKIKTVTMGDTEAEETARKKAEIKREQKKAAKKQNGQIQDSSSEIQEKTQETGSKKQAETSKEPESKVQTPKSKPGSRILSPGSGRYTFPPGKRYSAARSLVDPKKLYSLSEAIELAKKTSCSRFDGSIEAHYNVSDKNLRGLVSLPHGTGKQVRVVIATDELIKTLESNPKIEFDVLVAEPSMMPKLSKVAKILGPKGLMPNPKTGTIGPDPEKLAKDLSGGQMQWKTQPDFPIIHTVVGKVSFEDKKLAENLAALTKSIGRDKIKSVFIKATMGPSIRLEIS